MERPIELLSGIETLSVPRVTANLRKNLTVPNAKGENQAITLILLENLGVLPHDQSVRAGGGKSCQ